MRELGNANRIVLQPLGDVVRGRLPLERRVHGEQDFIDPAFLDAVEQAIDRRLQPGVEVVLDDPAWPESAQMFTIGIVERVEQDENQPLRSVIVVRPRDGLELRRVREVVLRVPVDLDEDPSDEAGPQQRGGAP